jgi:hypothetical protein
MRSYIAAMDAGRDELHQLIDQMSDHEVASLLALARKTESHGRRTGSWPPAFFAFGPANDGRRDTSDRVDEALAEGFAQHLRSASFEAQICKFRSSDLRVPESAGHALVLLRTRLSWIEQCFRSA